MDVDTAVRTRRTHKVFGPEPLDRATIEDLLELARWAPNHHLTNPWRFRVLGPQARENLKAAADADQPGSGAKLDRAPTLIAITQVVSDDASTEEEDRDAVAVSAYIVLLAAHARGLVGYWRTPGVLHTAAGRAALAITEAERTHGLLYLGPKRQDLPTPERAPLADVATFLD